MSARRASIIAAARAIAAALACTSLLALPPLAAAQSWFEPTLIDDSPPAPAARTRHQGEFNGQRVSYEAVTGETLLYGDDGEPATTVFSTAYLRSDADDPRARPILFLFNGGPGASSSPLHLGLGPVRRSASDGEAPLVRNSVSILDAVDLVFVDPPGTGYSRLFREGAGEAFWGIEEDADAILLFMEEWLERHGRRDSPVFVMGESYGATRVAALLARAGNVEFAGALLLSAALDYTASAPVPGNNLPYVFLLPSMAATAAYHGVVDRAGRSYREIFDEAADFAQSEFAAALYQGSFLTGAERRAIAGKVARHTGLPVSYVLEEDLRVSAWEFGDALLGGQGMRTGHLDARKTGKIADYADQRPPYNDPSMAGGGGGRSTGELLDEYFREQLDTKVERAYRSLNLDLNSKWNFSIEGGGRFYLTAVPLLQAAMEADPELRVFVGGGVFDLGTPVMAVRYAVSQVGVPPERFTFGIYDGGHSVFEEEGSRVRLGEDIRAFVADVLERNDGR